MLPMMLSGCKNTLTKQHSKALKRLDSVNADQLIRECKALLQNSKGKEVYDLPRESWPSTIRKIDPVMVRLSGNGFSVSLALEKGVAGHEMGIQVIPSEPLAYGSEPSTDTRKRMASHIYWYAD
jgi:hypothetical protein